MCGPSGGGDKTGPSPVDRGRLGSKHHLITDANGLPLACVLTAANVNDITQLLRLVDAIPPVRAGLDALAGGLTRWSGTAATTPTCTAEPSGSGASAPNSPVEATFSLLRWASTVAG